MQIDDAELAIRFPAMVLYPTEVGSGGIAYGQITLEITGNAPIADGRFPIVVISHGRGGSHLIYRTFAAHLAKHGYIVASLEHPGDNHRENHFWGTRDNLVNRPRHVRMTIDALCADTVFAKSVLPDRAAVIGHSMGGYTALAVAGGHPAAPSGEPILLLPDPRVRALALLAPATSWYQQADSLRHVRLPILMLTAEHDSHTPAWQAQLLLDRVPDPRQVTFRTVAGAGHFSFISPFPAAMTHADFAPSQDPPGFDRAQFHSQLGEELLAFLNRTLA